jgi:hypothetical protein
MLATECIAFVSYPLWSETSHDGGLVGLLYLRHISHVHSLLWLIVNFCFKDILLRRMRGQRMRCLCRCLYRHVERFSLFFTSSCLRNLFISKTIRSNKKMASNKAVPSLEWEIGGIEHL